MTAGNLAELADALLADVLDAGRIQMSYFRSGAAVVTKSDNTPVTEADQKSETRLLDGLRRVAPAIPVVAEESAADGRIPAIDHEFFLVDPLDGTREFIAGRPDFTINIALVRDGHPVFGLIYAPARDQLYFTRGSGHAFAATVSVAAGVTRLADVVTTRLEARPAPAAGLVVATSQSHMNEATEQFLRRFPVASRIRIGSSLKFCLIAKGEADIYPRIGRTSEWDTAAGQAILEAAGGSVTQIDGSPMTYGHAERRFLNPDYVAFGRAAL